MAEGIVRVCESIKSRDKIEEMLAGFLLAVLPFLNPILGSDLVVVSGTEAKGRVSRWKREANLLPRHWIDIKAEIRSRYVKMKQSETWYTFGSLSGGLPITCPYLQK